MNKSVALGGFAIIIIGGSIAMHMNAEPEDCRSATREDFQSFIEKNFRWKNDQPSWSKLSPGGRLDPKTISVALPHLGTPSPTSPDWTGLVTGVSESDGKEYAHMVMYSCGRGLEYTAAWEAKNFK